jgi:hypothetical protein
MSSAFIVFSPIEMIPELTTTLTKSNTGRAAKFRRKQAFMEGLERRRIGYN